MKTFYYKGWTIRYNESFPFQSKWQGTMPGKDPVCGGSVGHVESLIQSLTTSQTVTL
jgi:hypothetical protein